MLFSYKNKIMHGPFPVNESKIVVFLSCFCLTIEENDLNVNRKFGSEEPQLIEVGTGSKNP